VPIFDFQCNKCGHEFEAVLRPQDTPACPSCHSRDLVKLLSSFAVTTPEKKREVASRQVKKAAAVERKVQAERDADAEKHRHEEH
jgi:putative FmdB family regulatory protein